MQVCWRETFVQEMSKTLHDLCQPLTALQCRLEMAKMQSGSQMQGRSQMQGGSQIQGDSQLLLETVEDSLLETKRMFATIAVMRQRLLSEETRERAED